MADEDRFVLQQAKKKAAIRAVGARAQPIDWLAVTLAIIDPARNPLDDEVEVEKLEFMDPEGLFEGLGFTQLADLEKGIDTYLALETSRSNQEYWTVSLVTLLARSFTDANSVSDDEDHMSRATKNIQGRPILSKRRQLSRFRFRKTSRL